MSGIHPACSPLYLAALTRHGDSYAYIESHGDPVNVTAMTNCCAPQPAQEEGCYTWCRLPDKEAADISIPESRLSWEKNFQHCLNHEGRLANKSNGHFFAPYVYTVQNSRRGETISASTRQIEMGFKGAMFVALGVLSWVLV